MGSERSERNHGIDLLRMLCMLMVVTIHVLDNSGLTTDTRLFSANYGIAWFLNAASKCAVDCYALITGYVYVNSRFKPAKIIQMWFQVFFYSAGITFLFGIFRPEVLDFHMILASLCPLTASQYWYFTQYFCMFFFIPFLNHLLNTLEPLQKKQMIVTIVVLFSILNIFTNKDLFYVADGFSALWLAFMYFLGGYLRQNTKGIQRNKDKMLWVYIACVSILFFSKCIVQFVAYWLLGEPKDGSRLMLYTSPFVILAAVSLVCFFSELKLERFKGIIQFFGPLSFSVFLIHCHPLVLAYIMPGLLAHYREANPLIMLGSVLVTSLGIYLGCTLIDLVRVYLFRLMKIGIFSEWTVKKVINMGGRMKYKG